MESRGKRLDLTIQVQELRGVPRTAILTLQGSIDIKSMDRFERQIEALRNKGTARLVLDIGGLKSISSSGLGYLVNISEDLHRKKGELILMNPQPKVRVIIEALKLGTVFKIYSSREEALQQDIKLPPEPREIAICPTCQTKYRVKGVGRYRCPKCKNIFKYAPEGGSSG
jgi:anti-anti-sigma factor